MDCLFANEAWMFVLSHYAFSLLTDECFAVPHDTCGIVGMANSGKNTNSSQFYVTLSPAPWMDKQYVAFG